MNFFFENPKQKTIDKKKNNTDEIVKHNRSKISDLQNQIAIHQDRINNIEDLADKIVRLLVRLDTRVTQIENRNNKHIEPQNCGIEAPPLCIHNEFEKMPQANNNYQCNIMNSPAPKLSIEKIPPISLLSK